VPVEQEHLDKVMLVETLLEMRVKNMGLLEVAVLALRRILVVPVALVHHHL
jgi:hypothetical protein